MIFKEAELMTLRMEREVRNIKAKNHKKYKQEKFLINKKCDSWTKNLR
jgi:hypothetical protein